jgi:hypothetical protein
MVSFYDEAITSACRQGLDYLRHQAFIGDFYLAGGTALALQMGHRISTDLDWFSAQHRLLAPEREEIRLALSKSGQLLPARDSRTRPLAGTRGHQIC